MFPQPVVALLDQLDVEEAVVLGTSLGANTALEMAAAAPNAGDDTSGPDRTRSA